MLAGKVSREPTYLVSPIPFALVMFVPGIKDSKVIKSYNSVIQIQ